MRTTDQITRSVEALQIDHADGLIGERQLRTLLWADWLTLVCQVVKNQYPQTNCPTVSQQIQNAKKKLDQAKAAEEVAKAALAQAEEELKKAKDAEKGDD